LLRAFMAWNSVSSVWLRESGRCRAHEAGGKWRQTRRKSSKSAPARWGIIIPPSYLVEVGGGCF
jgi:hypothetical protein